MQLVDLPGALIHQPTTVLRQPAEFASQFGVRFQGAEFVPMPADKFLQEHGVGAVIFGPAD